MRYFDAMIRNMLVACTLPQSPKKRCPSDCVPKLGLFVTWILTAKFQPFLKDGYFILTIVAVFAKVIEGIQMLFFSASLNVFSWENGRRLWS